MTMGSSKQRAWQPIAQGLLAIIFLFASLTPALPVAMLTGQMPEMATRLSGWSDLLGVLGRIFPEARAVLDVIRLAVSLVGCAVSSVAG